jgi:class 3 adenylate cyclase
MVEHPPSGTVTFLLTDLEASTRMWEQDPVAMKAAMVRHDELLEKTIAANPLGEERRRAVRAEGVAMSMDEAIT